MPEIKVEKYTEDDVSQMVDIWNEVVEEGVAFPQEDKLTLESGREFFEAQTWCGVAKDENGKVYGLYILHPNNIGRCGHISNASYAVASKSRGMKIGEKLVRDCIKKAGEVGFKILQFNAVVAGNTAARKLYEKIGFIPLGTVPGGFRMKDGSYSDICLYYILLGEKD